MGRYEVVMSVLWIGFWLVPIAYVGTANQSVRFFPRYARDLQSVACLFPNEVTGWRTYHAEVQGPGDRTWHEVDLDDYFKVDIFGYRNQVCRMLSNAFAKRHGDKQMNEIAIYIRDQYGVRFPAEAKLAAVRFVRARHLVEDLAKQEGRFRRRPLDAIPWARVTPFGEVRFDGRRPQVDAYGRRIKEQGG
jgi:hypothetical protein